MDKKIYDFAMMCFPGSSDPTREIITALILKGTLVFHPDHISYDSHHNGFFYSKIENNLSEPLFKLWYDIKHIDN